MELLFCLGQALWERASAGEKEEYLRILKEEVEAGVSGEIDEETVHEKSLLFATIREGAGHRPAEWLILRLALFARWFPPDRGYRLFP